MYLLCRTQRDTEQVSVENRSASVERPSGSGPASTVSNVKILKFRVELKPFSSNSIFMESQYVNSTLVYLVIKKKVR